MNNYAIGGVFIILGVATGVCWWWDVLMLVKGLLPVLFVSIGTVAIAAELSPGEKNAKGKG
ncbi:MAG: hypothetical protein COB53_10865 [Elusimicrobia bacterium]|nr:MAG: hypothetical protein COB53_10865 [Elusimicrobiota bacterium]